MQSGRKIPEHVIYDFFAEAGDVMNCVEQRMIIDDINEKYIKNAQNFKMKRTIMKIQMN